MSKTLAYEGLEIQWLFLSLGLQQLLPIIESIDYDKNAFEYNTKQGVLLQVTSHYELCMMKTPWEYKPEGVFPYLYTSVRCFHIQYIEE